MSLVLTDLPTHPDCSCELIRYAILCEVQTVLRWEKGGPLKVALH